MSCQLLSERMSICSVSSAVKGTATPNPAGQQRLAAWDMGFHALARPHVHVAVCDSNRRKKHSRAAAGHLDGADGLAILARHHKWRQPLIADRLAIPFLRMPVTVTQNDWQIVVHQPGFDMKGRTATAQHAPLAAGQVCACIEGC